MGIIEDFLKLYESKSTKKVYRTVLKRFFSSYWIALCFNGYKFAEERLNIGKRTKEKRSIITMIHSSKKEKGMLCGIYLHNP